MQFEVQTHFPQYDFKNLKANILMGEHVSWSPPYLNKACTLTNLTPSHL